jgi:hypothetical protein
MSMHEGECSMKGMKHTHQLSGLEHLCEALSEIIPPTASHVIDIHTPSTKAFETLEIYLTIRGIMSTTLRLIEYH